jgi:hypothetical protein
MISSFDLSYMYYRLQLGSNFFGEDWEQIMCCHVSQLLIIKKIFKFFWNNPRHLIFMLWWFRLWLSQPHFGQVWGWSPTLAKLGIWSPLGLPNVQSSIARPKTPRIWVFLVSLKRSWNVDIENGLALVIWTSAAQVMGKRRAGSQTGNLTPDH